MKYILTIFLFFTGITDPVTKIAKSNRLKKEAKTAFDNAEFERAINSYGRLLDSLDVDDEDARLNMANAAYLISYGGDNLGLMSDISSGKTQVQDSATLSAMSDKLRYFDIAESNYRALKDANDRTIASSALNQMGIISYKMSEQSPDERESFIQSSLASFKGALKKNPQNESARYNYELLKKLKQQQEQQEQEQEQKQDQKQDQKNEDQKEQDQKNKDEKNKDQKDQKDQEQKQDQEQKEKDQKQDPQKQDQPQEQDPMEKIKEKLKEMNISPEKAQMILEAMKNNEIQYVQQNKRKASKRKDNSKPDW